MDTFQGRHVTCVSCTWVGVVAIDIPLTATADRSKRAFVGDACIGRANIVVVALRRRCATQWIGNGSVRTDTIYTCVGRAWVFVETIGIDLTAAHFGRVWSMAAFTVDTCVNIARVRIIAL